MASPQIENGYTRISNELYDKIISTKLNGVQSGILHAVIRYTYGFGRTSAELSEKFLSEATGHHKKNISKELKKLTDNKIIEIISKSSFNSPRILAINKNYDEWESNDLQGVNRRTGSQLTTTTGSQLVDSTGSQLTTQEKKTIKKTINIYAQIEENFTQFYAAYPKKKDKANALKAFKKLNPNKQLFDIMMSAIEKQKQSDDWKRENGKFIPYPATWINGKRWEDDTEGTEGIKPARAGFFDDLSPEELENAKELLNQ